MNFRRQVITLVKHDITVTPPVWIFFGLLIFHLVIFQQTKYVNNLTLLTIPYRTISWLPLIIAGFLFDNGIFNNNKWVTPQTQRMSTALNLEFLLTRPIDRMATFWSRNIIYWFMILVPLIIWLFIAIQKPSLTLEITQKSGPVASKVAHYLHNLPGSSVSNVGAQGNVTLHSANATLVLKLTMASSFIVLAMISQAFILIISGKRYARILYFSAFAFLIASPSVADFLLARHSVENLIFYLFTHFYVLIAVFIAVLTFIHFSARKTFINQEFP